MSVNLVGADALNALTSEAVSVNNNEFSSFKTGTKYYVKVLGVADIMSFYSYGIYKVVNSFVAKNPSKKSASGFPVENLTSWDKAWKYHKDLSKDWTDQHGVEASKYRAKNRFAMGFYNVETGEQIVIDVSKGQAATLHETIKKFEKRLSTTIFELEKSGQGTATKVSLTPLFPDDEAITEKMQANFDKAPEQFDVTKFEGILYEMDDDEMLEKLHEAGFDLSLIGEQLPNKDGEQTKADESNSEEEDYAF